MLNNKIRIQECVLNENTENLHYIKERMMIHLKELINELSWDDIVNTEEREKCKIYTINLNFD